MDAYIRKIINTRVYDVAVETPVDRMPFLSERLGAEVKLKREDLQPVFSFKIRGAYSKIASLTEEEKARGIIAASAGNHAQGVALSAQYLGIKAVIVMPSTTPEIKVKGVRSRGAEVVLFGDSFPEALSHTHDLIAKHGYTFIHPYDDPDTIAGQGTIGMELTHQCHDMTTVFLPVGGGGIAAGVAVWLKAVRPDVKIVTVEPEDAACFTEAYKAGERVVLPFVGLFADGVAVSQVGEETFRLLKDRVDETITVTTDQICGAIKDIYDDNRAVSEPAGALALAGLKKYAESNDVSGETLVAISSGANINFDRLRYISERTELGEKREAILAVTIPEKPGSFRVFCEAIGKRNITEFNYRFKDEATAHIFVGISIDPKTEDRDDLVCSLRDKGYAVEDLTDNELAKVHVRHMVGGHAPVDMKPECVFSLKFPERPGALLNFLNTLGERWNISMFHYRNHGAAYGRVMVALQADPHDRQAVANSLKELGYTYEDETENPAVKLFLA